MKKDYKKEEDLFFSNYLLSMSEIYKKCLGLKMNDRADELLKELAEMIKEKIKINELHRIIDTIQYNSVV